MFKLRLTFDICCMASKERRVPQIEEDLNLLYHRSMCQYICIKLEHNLTCGTEFAVTEADDPEETFRMVLELSDNMPDKAELLDNCGASFAGASSAIQIKRKISIIASCFMSQRFDSLLRAMQTCPAG